MSDQGSEPNHKLSIVRDFTSGLVVFLVALPLCLGIALASDAPLMSGLLSGIIGGIVAGWLSGSHTSVAGPAAGLTAIVAAQIVALGSFEAFLLAVFISGLMQIALGIARAGALSAFFPSSVIKGLLAAIGVILILKQIPHVLGHDTDPEGEMSFQQPDDQNTFTEILTVLAGDVHQGAIVVGIVAIALLVIWGRVGFLKNSIVPGPLAAVMSGVAFQLWFQKLGGSWVIEASHLVQIPVAKTTSDLVGFLRFPDFSQWTNPAIYLAAATVAIVASLETLLNLEATDRLDPKRRHSPPSRELLAQGAGNMLAGLVGGLPMTSVIVRSSVNIASGATSKLATIVHGVLLLVCVAMFPIYVNMIPLASLAAILLVTGFKLASPALFRQMWQEGRYQFTPFLVTLITIVLTDLLIGILVGLAFSILFILNSNLRNPIRRIVETHLGGDVMHIELPNQVSFLNRASLGKVFNETPRDSHLLISANSTDYIDPDILSLIREFKDTTAPARGITVSLRGFRSKYYLNNEIQFADYSTRELQDQATPQQVLEVLQDGNRRFRTGQSITRDFGRQVDATAGGQNPLAVVLSCIDSRVPAELILDLGIGDIFSVRVAGNVIGTKSLGSIEYGVTVAGAKLVLVLGHTRCGAVTSSIELLGGNKDVEQATGCPNLSSIVGEIERSVSVRECRDAAHLSEHQREAFIDDIAKRNVLRIVQEISQRSSAIRRAIEQRKVLVVGALYDVKSGEIKFFLEDARPHDMLTT